MNKFKVGQKVKIIRTGEIGVINKIDNNDFAIYGCSHLCYLVEHSNKIDWFTVHDIELVKEVLDEKEKEYLNNVIKPFRNRAIYIVKEKCLDNEYIKIGIADDVNINLPYFKKDKMYKGMESHKKYTLSELGLED